MGDHVSPPGGRIPFPQSESDFANDNRVYFDREANTHHLEDGYATYEWNTKYNKWIEVMDQTAVEAYMDSYSTTKINEEDAIALNKKRKAEELAAAEEQKKAKKDVPKVSTNTSIYVTGLPLDVDLGEVIRVFKRYGVLSNNVDSGLPKVKLYKDEEGNFKGEAFISYFKRESVAMAVEALDGSYLRFTGDCVLSVQEADPNYKKQKDPLADGAKRAHGKRKDQEKIKQMTAQQNAKLTDWDEDDPSAIPTETATQPEDDWTDPKYYVVVKNMFTLEELKENPDELENIPAEINEIAESYGKPTNVVMYDLEPEGVVTIRFETAEMAMNCAKGMNGYPLDSDPPRKIKAYVPRKHETYRQSGVEALYPAPIQAGEENGKAHDERAGVNIINKDAMFQAS